MSLCRLDKIKNSAHIVSFTSATDLKNGNVVVTTGLKAGERELYNATAPTDVTKQIVVLHSSDPLTYDERESEDDFVLKAGKAGRGYILEVGDIITLTDDLITGETATTGVVIAVNGANKLKYATAVTTATPEKLVFKVLEKTYLNGQKATALEVIAV